MMQQGFRLIQINLMVRPTHRPILASCHGDSQLKAAVRDGKFTFHLVGTEVRVLEDINTMVTVSDTLGDVFKDNQTVRVIDQIGNDIAPASLQPSSRTLLFTLITPM